MRKLINTLAIFAILLLIGCSTAAFAEGMEDAAHEVLEAAVIEDTTQAPLEEDISVETEIPQEPAISDMDDQEQNPDAEVPFDESADVSEETEALQEENTVLQEEEAAEVSDETQPEIDISKLKVEIFSSLDDAVCDGETIYLTCKLTGFDNIKYTLQWQMNNGGGWVDVKGATGSSHSFKADAKSIQCKWRLSVNIVE